MITTKILLKYMLKDQILLRDKTQKNKLNPLWTGHYEVTDVLDK